MHFSIIEIDITAGYGLECTAIPLNQRNTTELNTTEIQQDRVNHHSSIATLHQRNTTELNNHNNNKIQE